MATHFFYRSLPKTQAMASLLSRSLTTATSAASLSTAAQSRSSSLSLLHRLRPLAGVMASAGRLSPAIVRCLSTRSTTSSLRDPNPNWSNRPPKETILLDGCDFEHWLVVMEPPQGDITRDEIINSYIKTLATVVGSEEEARMKIYSVSTRCYYAFGALVSEEVSLKIKELPGVRWVLPDSYLDVKNKDYGGEPFINGQAVPYDPKYHEEWIRNNSRANERNRRNDRPRNFDRSRNFERRRENTGPSPMPNQAGPNSGPGPANMGPGPMPPNMGPPPPNRAPMPPHNMGPPNNYNNPPPSSNWNSGPPNNYNQAPPNNYNQAPPNNYNQAPPNNYNQMPPNNPGGVPPNIMGPPSNAGWNGAGQYQNNYTPDRDGGANPGPNRY
ncbi:multiple organellar RNA editing factor 8, chloroplastic/mitochondrial-like [Malus sylvestris]|uniref:multiple organellar RNA editing factor 8, chloroplastic/mitochondrial-like n=1 Tax=Malus sylvestris TaxID=3752 RepID=UPI0021AC792E|nr:multiple organellar RNA editing factor 8, chloroplastic/mitochondrial-like [Malus sylvestris]